MDNAHTIEARRIVRDEPELAAEIARQLDAGLLGCDLTGRQRECFEFIREYILRHGNSPSFGEMQNALGISSKSSVHRLVHALEDRGYISIKPGLWRSISLRRHA